MKVSSNKVARSNLVNLFFNSDYGFTKDSKFFELCYESLSELIPGEGPMNLIKRSKVWKIILDLKSKVVMNSLLLSVVLSVSQRVLATK